MVLEKKPKFTEMIVRQYNTLSGNLQENQQLVAITMKHLYLLLETLFVDLRNTA